MKKVTMLILTTTLMFFFLLVPPVHAWLQDYEIYSYEPYGFFSGLWHGLIAPFALIAQLFDHDIVLYSTSNTGLGYNLGFLIGISVIVGGGSKATNKD